jgi:hypothetical protein
MNELPAETPSSERPALRQKFEQEVDNAKNGDWMDDVQNPDIVNFVHEHPALREALGRAYAQRILDGGMDFQGSNWCIEETIGGKAASPDGPIHLTDVDQKRSFSTDKEPTFGAAENLQWGDQAALIRSGAFAGKLDQVVPGLQAELDKRIAYYKTPEGRAALSKAGLSNAQIDARIARAESLSKEGFPKLPEGDEMIPGTVWNVSDAYRDRMLGFENELWNSTAPTKLEDVLKHNEPLRSGSGPSVHPSDSSGGSSRSGPSGGHSSTEPQSGAGLERSGPSGAAVSSDSQLAKSSKPAGDVELPETAHPLTGTFDAANAAPDRKLTMTDGRVSRVDVGTGDTAYSIDYNYKNGAVDQVIVKNQEGTTTFSSLGPNRWRMTNQYFKDGVEFSGKITISPETGSYQREVWYEGKQVKNTAIFDEKNQLLQLTSEYDGMPPTEYKRSQEGIWYVSSGPGEPTRVDGQVQVSEEGFAISIEHADGSRDLQYADGLTAHFSNPDTVIVEPAKTIARNVVQENGRIMGLEVTRSDGSGYKAQYTYGLEGDLTKVVRTESDGKVKSYTKVGPDRWRATNDYTGEENDFDCIIRVRSDGSLDMREWRDWEPRAYIIPDFNEAVDVPRKNGSGGATNPAVEQIRDFVSTSIPDWQELSAMRPSDEQFYVFGSPNTSAEIFVEQFRRKFGYGILTDEGIEAIRALQEQTNGKVIEIGAGTGYNAKLMEANGVKLEAYDASPVESGDNPFFPSGANPRSFTEVKQADISVLQNSQSNDILFMSWPKDSSMVADALNSFKGKYVVVIDTSENDVARVLSQDQSPWALKKTINPEIIPGVDTTQMVGPVRILNRKRGPLGGRPVSISERTSGSSASTSSSTESQPGSSGAASTGLNGGPTETSSPPLNKPASPNKQAPRSSSDAEQPTFTGTIMGVHVSDVPADKLQDSNWLRGLGTTTSAIKDGPSYAHMDPDLRAANLGLLANRAIGDGLINPPPYRPMTPEGFVNYMRGSGATEQQLEQWRVQLEQRQTGAGSSPAKANDAGDGKPETEPGDSQPPKAKGAVAGE